MYTIIATVLFTAYVTVAWKNLQAINLMEQQIPEQDEFNAESMRISIKGLFQTTLWLTIFMVLALVLIISLSYSELPG